MTTRRDGEGDMRRPGIDDATADRLLAGSIAPDDAPPGLAGVAAAIRAAQAAAGEVVAPDGALVAAVAAAVRDTVGVSPVQPQRKPMLTKLLTVKMVAIGGVALFGATAAAASTNSLPTPAQDAVATALGKAGVSVPRSDSHGNSEFGHCRAFLAGAEDKRDGKEKDKTDKVKGADGDDTAETTSSTAASTSTTVASTSSTTAAPPTTVAGSSKDEGGKLQAGPFARLVAAHGGIEGTTTYCQGVVAAKKAKGPHGTTTTVVGVTSTTKAHGKSGDQTPSTDHGRSAGKGKQAQHGDDGTTSTTGTVGSTPTTPTTADDGRHGRPTTSTTGADETGTTTPTVEAGRGGQGSGKGRGGH